MSLAVFSQIGGGGHRWLLALLVVTLIQQVKMMVPGDNHRTTHTSTTNLNFHCFKDTECGTNAVCSDGKCQCKVNNVANLNHKDCHFKPCSYDWDCHIEHTTCNPDGKCSCKFGFEFDSKQAKCVKNNKCWFNFMCGQNSYCHQSKCQCHLGYVRSRNGIDCHLLTCDSESDCFQWSNAKCNILGYCACKEGFYSGWNSHSCLKIDTNNYGNYSFLAQNVFTIVIITNFLLWLSIFIFILQYAKKRRLAAANSSAMRGRRNLPPGIPPPPPAYDNIGFDPVSYPPPPPYTPNEDGNNDPNKTTATSTSTQIQPQQAPEVIIAAHVPSHLPNEPAPSYTPNPTPNDHVNNQPPPPQ